MSISTSVVLRPSKTLRFCVISFAVLLLLISVYIGSLKTLSLLNQTLLIALCCFAAWRCVVYDQKIAQASWHMQINAQGQLRCNDQLIYLMAETTLWTQILFLRWHDPEQNSKVNLLILADALSKDDFRRLAVACKWLVAHAELVNADTI